MSLKNFQEVEFRQVKETNADLVQESRALLGSAVCLFSGFVDGLFFDSTCPLLPIYLLVVSQGCGNNARLETRYHECLMRSISLLVGLQRILLNVSRCSSSYKST